MFSVRVWLKLFSIQDKFCRNVPLGWVRRTWIAESCVQHAGNSNTTKVIILCKTNST